MVTNTAKMDTLIITMGTRAIQRKVILITIKGKLWLKRPKMAFQAKIYFRVSLLF